MGDECCFLLSLISNKRQVFGVHVMIEAPVNTCSQKINVKFFPTLSSSIKTKNPINADHEKREAEVISPYLYISVSKGCVIMLKKITRMDGHGLQQYSIRLQHLNNVRAISHTLLHHRQPELFLQTRMEPYFHVFYTRFWPYRPNITAEFETHQTRRLFFNLVLSNFGEIMWTVASVFSS